jgi:hypothetical protein
MDTLICPRETCWRWPTSQRRPGKSFSVDLSKTYPKFVTLSQKRRIQSSFRSTAPTRNTLSPSTKQGNYLYSKAGIQLARLAPDFVASKQQPEIFITLTRFNTHLALSPATTLWLQKHSISASFRRRRSMDWTQMTSSSHKSGMRVMTVRRFQCSNVHRSSQIDTNRQNGAGDSIW